MLNEGIAFGLWQGIPIWIIIMAWGIVLVCALKTRELWERSGLGLILLGGGANLIARITGGGVWDNWSMGTVGYNNWADYLIFFGVVLYGYSHFVRGQRDRRNR